MAQRTRERPPQSGRSTLNLTRVAPLSHDEPDSVARKYLVRGVGVTQTIAGLVAAVMLAQALTGIWTHSVAAPLAWLVGSLVVRASATIVSEDILSGVQRRQRARWFGVAVGHLATGDPGTVHEVDAAVSRIGEEPMVDAVSAAAAAAPIGLVIVFVVGGWLPTLIVVGLTALCVPVYAHVGRQSASVATEYQRRRRALVVRQLDLLRSLLDLRALGAVSHGADEIAAESDAEHRAVIRGVRVTIRSTLVSEFLGGVTVGLVAMVVGLRLWHHDIALFRALVAVLVTAEMGAWLRRYGAEFHRRDDARAARAILTAGDSSPVTPSTTLMEVVNVSTAAPSAPVSFRVDAGERLAIHGPSGVGKTFLLEAALGLRPVATGHVRVPAVPVGLIRATNHFVDASVRDNLLTATGASGDAVTSVMASLGLGAFSDVDRSLGADGQRMSTGEGVLLAIARAVIAGAKLLVLDDVASVLDVDAREHLTAFLDAHPEVAVVEAAHDVRILRRTDFHVELVPS